MKVARISENKPARLFVPNRFSLAALNIKAGQAFRIHRLLLRTYDWPR